MLDSGDTILRLAVATLAGGILGLDRELEAKPIGLRTLALVSLGAATVCVMVLNNPTLTGDTAALSRVMQGTVHGLMTGIGFLGAGLVLQVPTEGRVRFLTSAATIWVTAAIGIACGFGEWLVVGSAMVLALFVLVVLHPFDDWLQARKKMLLKRKHDRDGADRPQ